jgi:signal transduction histidine kinase
MNLREHLILYVDDEHANRVVFDASFGKQFLVKCVASGEEAIAFVAREPVAVIVSDQRMTGMSGDELLRRVREVSPDTIRMILTAYDDLEPILKAVNEGLVARYELKPWERSELEETLRWAVEAYVAGRRDNALQLRLVQTERLRTLGQVSATILHDLNQPLMAISMSADQLSDLSKVAPTLVRLAKEEAVRLSREERAALGQLGEDLPEVAGTLSTCAAFMSDLTKQMKQFQRAEAADPTSGGDIAPLPVVKLALSMCRSGGFTGGSTLAYEGPKDLPRVRATSTDLMQILLNLVRNAQQALEEHGVRQGIVVVNASAHDHGVTFMVRDNGPGIPAAVLSKLGTPFFTTRDAGTGLGVAQVKRIVARLRGEVRIESAEGNGTTVSFTLPTADAT